MAQPFIKSIDRLLEELWCQHGTARPILAETDHVVVGTRDCRSAVPHGALRVEFTNATVGKSFLQVHANHAKLLAITGAIDRVAGVKEALSLIQ